MLTDLITTSTDTITADMNNKWEQYIDYIKRTAKYEYATIDTAHAFANKLEFKKDSFIQC